MRKVKYSITRANRPFAEADETDIFLKKGIDWKYEEEWRMIMPLDNSNKVMGTDPKVYLFDIPPKAIKAIILGCRVSESLANSIHNIFHTDARWSHLELKRALLDKQEYSLLIMDEPM